MATRPPALLTTATALTLLVGCAATPAGPTSTPSAPATEPSPTATATPTATPTPTPTPVPSGADADSNSDTLADAPRCADGIVIDPEGAYNVGWQGTYDEQIAASDPRPGFEPAGLLDSEGVLCSVVYDFPLDGPGAGVGRFSTALVRDPAALASVQAWALANGFEPLEPGGEPSEFALPGEGELFRAKLLAYEIGDPLYGSVELEGLERRSGLDLEPTDVVVTHVTFEAPAS